MRSILSALVDKKAMEPANDVISKSRMLESEFVKVI